MKKNPIILLLILMLFIFDMDLLLASNNTSFNDNISFYKVPFVCNAAPSIGCGSRSKPVLLELEKSDIIKEAWLNRQGNIIAVVWNDNSTLEDRNNAATNAFTKHKVNASQLMMDDYAKSLESFSSNKGWYNSTDVNALSKEEAGIIADQLLAGIKEKTTFNESDEQAYRKEIQQVFYDFFLNFESLDQLGDAKIYKNKLQEIIKIGEKYVGEGNMPTEDELWVVCSGGTSACEHKGSAKNSCCDKTDS